MVVRVLGICVWVSTSLLACSEEQPDAGQAGSAGVSVGGSSGAEAGGATTGGAAGSAGQASGGGVAATSGGGAATSGGGGATSGGAVASGGKPTTPSNNCGELNCDVGQICVSLTRTYSAVKSAHECAAPPDGCNASSLCDCKLPDWKGSPITGCVAIGRVPNLYVTDYSCGDAPCGSDEICLVHNGDKAPASCVAPPEGCPVDASFCEGDCDKQAAEAAGFALVSCRSEIDSVGVTVR